jgi:osmotically-inducible protein OsmY
MKYSLVRLTALLISFSIASIACRPNQTVEGQARDAKIKTDIKAKLASDVGAATLTSIQVNVTNGVVTLAGSVHSDEEKGRVETIAKAAEGVVSVNDALQVMPEPAPAGGGGMTTTTPAGR